MSVVYLQDTVYKSAFEKILQLVLKSVCIKPKLIINKYKFR